MTARQVKHTLSERLRGEKQFVGAGVMQKNGEEYVLVRLLDTNFDLLRATIPDKIDDVDIKVERSGPIVAFSL